MVCNSFRLRLLDSGQFRHIEFSFPLKDYHMYNDLHQLHNDRIYMQYKSGLGGISLDLYKFQATPNLPRPSHGLAQICIDMDGRPPVAIGFRKETGTFIQNGHTYPLCSNRVSSTNICYGWF